MDILTSILTLHFVLFDIFTLILYKIESLLQRFKQDGLLQIDGPNQFIEVEVGFQNCLQIVTKLRANYNIENPSKEHQKR